MKRLISISLAILTALCLLVATDRKAWGYVDPGTGLLALQGIASAFATFGYFFRRRIKTLFSQKEIEAKVISQVATKEGNSTV